MSDSAADKELSAVYRRCGPAIYRRALALLGDKQEALDVTQDTFLAYIEARSSWRGDASPFTILYRIVTFRAIDRLRYRARWTGALDPLELRDEEGSPRSELALPSTDGSMGQAEALCDLAILTRDESPEMVSAAVYYFVDRWTLEELVKEMGSSNRKQVSTLLKQFIQRARKRSPEPKARVKP